MSVETCLRSWVVRTQTKLEISEMIGGDVHRHLDPGSRIVVANNHSSTKRSATFTFPWSWFIPGVSTYSTAALVLIVMPVIKRLGRSSLDSTLYFVLKLYNTIININVKEKTFHFKNKSLLNYHEHLRI